ncbi:MAG: DNA-directed RNA polymerase subunit beta, partial [Myxococcota bacterium]
MATAIKLGSAVRRSFAKIQTKPKIPSLIEIQRQSYERFLQTEIAPRKRKNTGLQAAFDSVFPIRSYNEAAALEFVSYRLGQPKYSVRECCNRSVTYAAPLYVSVRLVIWDESSQGSSRAVRDVKEQEVYFGEVPLMTELGTFIINGSERVVVSQLHRSPGVFFDSDKGNNSSGGKLLYNARIIPYRGSWLDFEFDHKDLLHCRIDRRRKFPATVLLRALGYGVEELLSFFYRTETLLLQGSGKYAKQVDFELLSGQRATQEVLHPKTGEVIVAKSRKFTRMALEKMRKAGVKTLPLDSDEIEKLFCAKDIVDRKSGEVLLRCNERLQVESLEKARSAGLRQVPVLFIDGLNVGSYLRDTLEQDRVESQEEAVLEIYRRMRPGDPPNLEIASGLFHNLFFNSERYDLSEVGRLKLNQKFGLEEPLSNRVLTKQDLLGVVRYLIDLRNGNGSVDDIDHLGNRRVRSVGELLENQYRIGLVRMERVIKER